MRDGTDAPLLVEQGMGHRVVLSLAIVLVSTTIGLGSRTEIVRRVHEPNICWDPDVESPVACDEDDD